MYKRRWRCSNISLSLTPLLARRLAHLVVQRRQLRVGAAQLLPVDALVQVKDVCHLTRGRREGGEGGRRDGQEALRMHEPCTRATRQGGAGGRGWSACAQPRSQPRSPQNTQPPPLKEGPAHQDVSDAQGAAHRPAAGAVAVHQAGQVCKVLHGGVKAARRERAGERGCMGAPWGAPPASKRPAPPPHPSPRRSPRRRCGPWWRWPGPRGWPSAPPWPRRSAGLDR